MSEPTPNHMTEANDLERLDILYRAAVNHRGPARNSMIAAARQEIMKVRGPRGEDFIASIEREMEHDGDIDHVRRQLADALKAADDAVGNAAAAIDRACSDHLYDIEIAEGDTDAMRAALTGIRMHVAALHHLTRYATPEDRT